MLFAMIIFGLQLVAAGLRVKYYAGATISGHPISIGTVDSLELALHNFSGSAEVSGVLSPQGMLHSTIHSIALSPVASWCMYGSMIISSATQSCNLGILLGPRMVPLSILLCLDCPQPVLGSF